MHAARWVALAVALVASCGSPQEAAWPKSAGTTPVKDWKEDGGDSLEPRSGAVEVESGGARDPQPDAAPAGVLEPGATRDGGIDGDGGGDRDGGADALVDGELTIDVNAPPP